MLNQNQLEAYQRDGYLKVEGLFTAEEVRELGREMDWIIKEWWGEDSTGWRGPWRDHYLPEGEQEETKAVFLGNPHFYSAAWGRVIFHPQLTGCVGALINDAVQWHHTVLHAKPPERGTPFPMHQDYPFYPHDGPHFVDCLVHLDEAPLESGCLWVVPGSHSNGPLEHITGDHTRPYLPPENYHPQITESVPVPAKAGDVIFFSYYLIHWSDLNRSAAWRRSVRIGFHAARMRPVGQDPQEAYNKIMVGGVKARGQEAKLTYK
jgi:phytanoyl-CoA hydroxylase